MNPRRRNSNRLKDFDYSLPGAYFATLVTIGRKPIFGKFEGDKVALNEIGSLAKEEWIKSGGMRKEIRLDEFIVMPNHLHAILFIDYLEHGLDTFDSRRDDSSTGVIGAYGRTPLLQKPRSLGSLVAAYKAATTKRSREIVSDNEMRVWQRNYYDHIIRDQVDLDHIREYIAYNPLKLSSGDYFK
jgi:REP element-mobilizing transposase RayT